MRAWEAAARPCERCGSVVAGCARRRHAEALPLCARASAALEAALGASDSNVASALLLQARKHGNGALHPSTGISRFFWHAC